MNEPEAVEPGPEGLGDLRPRFHRTLDEIREDVATLSAGVTENIPRATEILLTQDLEGAQSMILADDEIDIDVPRPRGALLLRARSAGTGRR